MSPVGTFRYSARRLDGVAIRGEIEAANAEAAAAQIQNGGLIPVDIVRATEDRTLRLRLRPAVIKADELVMFCRQMYTLTRAGVPLVRTLKGLAETSRNSALADALTEMTQSLQSGRTLTQAMRNHPKVFSELMVSTIHMGEESGRLEEAFNDLAKHLERDAQTLKQIKQATRYPVTVIGALVAAMVVINIWVIPSFSAVFRNLGADLPWATQILIGSSDFVIAHGFKLLIVTMITFVGLRIWSGTKRGGYLLNAWKLRIPLVGRLLEQAALARFARAYSMSARSGAAVLTTLQTIAGTLDNSYLAEKVGLIGDRIERGETLSSSAAASGLFTPLVLQMISVGEESGSIDELLEEVADYYDREVAYDLKRLSDAIEPILITGLGVIVLVLALGIYLPLWDLAQAARGS